MRVIKTSLVTFLTLTLATPAVWGLQSHGLSFWPTPKVRAEISAKGREVSVTLKNGSYVTTKKIQVETEKSLKLLVDDYNFDGYPDFSISHVDDGMGTYTIYQLYVYSAKENKFNMLQPQCGDEFINIVVSRTKRSLTNSYFSENELKTCTVKY